MPTAVLDLEETPVTAPATRLIDAGPLTDAHAVAWEKFRSLPMPARNDEHWRFSNVKALDLAPFTAPLPVDDTVREDVLARSTALAGAAGRMVFANDQLLARDVLADTLRQKGVL